jgi:hypothetical protein
VPAEQFELCFTAHPVESVDRIDEDVCQGEKVPPAHAVQERSLVVEAAAE